MELPPLTVDLERGVVRGGDREVLLRPLELRLLRWLAENPGRTWPRERVLEEVWGYGPGVVSRTLDTTLSRLRAKIEVDSRSPRYLITVPGEGVRLELPSTSRPLTLGRRRELAELERALACSRLVTLTGLGGAGKTHLARELCARRGGLFCAAESAVDEAGLVTRIASSLQADTHEVEALAERLRGVSLLVVDNVEQALPAAAALLPRLPGPTLVTSRLPLGVPAERVVRLGGLDPESARRLYALRGGREASTELLDLLGRLPLAILLAARWDGLLTSEQLAERLRLGIDLLVSEEPDTPPRQRSMGRVLRDTVLRLPGDTAEALRQLARLSGSFDLEQAEEVAGPLAPLHLRALVRSSLAHRHGGRFSLTQLLRPQILAAGEGAEPRGPTRGL